MGDEDDGLAAIFQCAEDGVSEEGFSDVLFNGFSA